MTRRQYTDHFRMEIVKDMRKGVPKRHLSDFHGVPLSTLKCWDLTDRKPLRRHLAHREATVSEVRQAYAMVAKGLGDTEIARKLLRHRNTIALWKNDPSWVEARYVYDPEKAYDINDLEDRAIVAQHLATQEPSKEERLELMLAAAFGPTEETS